MVVNDEINYIEKEINKIHRLRNLPQYKEMSDEEFAKIVEEKLSGFIRNDAFEKRIERKIQEFGEDYALEDLKVNDKLTLRALAQAYIQLEDLESHSFMLRVNLGDQDYDLIKVERINSVMSALRKDISNMQTDLDITRKLRKGDKETSVISYLDNLKAKAKEFYEQKMFYVWCESCNELLFTGWFLYPEEKNNKIQLFCNRKLDNGEICGHKTQITSKELFEKRGVNKDNVPEYFK